MLFSGVCWYFPVVFTNSTCASKVSKLLAASVFFGRYLQHSGIGGGKSTFLAILRRGRGTALVTFRPDKKNWSWCQLISSEGLRDFLLRHLKGCVFSDYELTDSFMHVLGLVTPLHQDKRKPASCFKPLTVRYTTHNLPYTVYSGNLRLLWKICEKLS